jgi:hypothetical protein
MNTKALHLPCDNSFLVLLCIKVYYFLLDMKHDRDKKMSIITRRNFIKSTALLAIGLNIDDVSASTKFTGNQSINWEEIKPSQRRHWSVNETKVRTLRYFQKQGYSRVAPVSIISDLDYNEGLNYDEAVYFDDNQARFVLQSCSRSEDIAHKNKPGTLPIFTILGYSWQLDSDFTGPTKLLFDYLIGHVGLDPSRLRVTTTELAEPLFSTFEFYGVFLPQIRLRSLQEAKDSGDGSGFFRPHGHPDSPDFPTYSVEYVFSAKTQEKQKSYDFDTPINEIELAEIGLNNDFGFSAGAIGLDRVMMAKNDKAMYWESYLPVFKHAVLAEAQREQKQLPLGYHKILGLQPNND